MAWAAAVWHIRLLLLGFANPFSLSVWASAKKNVFLFFFSPWDTLLLLLREKLEQKALVDLWQCVAAAAGVHVQKLRSEACSAAAKAKQVLLLPSSMMVELEKEATVRTVVLLCLCRWVFCTFRCCCCCFQCETWTKSLSSILTTVLFFCQDLTIFGLSYQGDLP